MLVRSRELVERGRGRDAALGVERKDVGRSEGERGWQDLGKGLKLRVEGCQEEEGSDGGKGRV